MERDDAEGAKAFAEYYFQVASFAQATGDTRQLARVQAPDCRACTGAREWIDDVYSAGGKIVGGHMAARALAATPLAVPGGRTIGFSVSARLQSSRGSVVNQLGETTRKAAASSARVSLSVSMSTEGEWQVEFWEKKA
ncbi:DUF6318 family protein [Nocardioides daejeonensis]|uniref:DUF6318 family protein n=1 Tax=Nocardioides daejeonensis TaxID=1046556 RepID=UPI003B849227